MRRVGESRRGVWLPWVLHVPTNTSQLSAQFSAIQPPSSMDNDKVTLTSNVSEGNLHFCMYVCKILEVSTGRNLEQDRPHDGEGAHSKDSDVYQFVISDYFNPSEYQFSQADLEFSPYNFYHHSDNSGFFLKQLLSQWKQKGNKIQNFIICKIPDLTRCARGIKKK